jgi:hypothetical protein
MGANDHVCYEETECLNCGAVDDWEYWDEVGKQRYTGALGAMLGRHPENSGKCPECGSTCGRIVSDDVD